MTVEYKNAMRKGTLPRVACPAILMILAVAVGLALFLWSRAQTRDDRRLSGAVPDYPSALGARPVSESGAAMNPEPVPELRQCTRLEIQYHPSTMEYFDIFVTHPGLLDSAEREYLQSLKRAVVDDTQIIAMVADCLRSGSYSQTTQAAVDGQKYMEIHCYHYGEHTTSFSVYGHQCIITADGRRFVPDVWPALTSLAHGLYPLSLRLDCARNLLELNARLSPRTAGTDPIKWCDATVGVPKARTAWERRRAERRLARQRQPWLECPGAGRDDRRSDYAMNRNCRADSPADTVFLFEAKPGWNQCGGPDLFMFDNHHPRGGCVLLHDGTVKFIRTEQESMRLRW